MHPASSWSWSIGLVPTDRALEDETVMPVPPPLLEQSKEKPIWVMLWERCVLETGTSLLPSAWVCELACLDEKCRIVLVLPGRLVTSFET